MNSSASISPARRATILFANFFLIILAYYHVKPASRSLAIEYIGSDNLPYVWIGTALFLGVLVGYYHRLVEHYDRRNVVLATCVAVMALLVLFRFWLSTESTVAAVAFYIFVDIFSVVLVEQFWSLTNTVYTTDEGKRWYGVIATGGLLGGVVGGSAAALVLRTTPATTEDMLLIGAGILILVFALNLAMARLGVYREAPIADPPIVAEGGWRTLLQSRYLFLIAATLLLAQLVQPLVEYQFIKTIEATYVEKDLRTAFLSTFFAAMGLISIGVNLTLTPLIHRTLGAIAGLLVQPVMVMFSSLVFMAQPVLWAVSMLKISDRGVSYSINRASKELLYVPIDPVRTYQAKAWIDIFGYRAFKVFGSLIILALQWLAAGVGLVHFSWPVLIICVIWFVVIASLAQEYRSVSSRPLTASQAA
ncbi:MAG: NTP/NDP exchange transporter, partial [Gammaproteobacteria bacterium]